MTTTTHPLRVPVFRHVWLAAAGASLGTGLFVAVGTWLAWELTASSAWVAIVASGTFVPTLVLGPSAGALADRRDRARLLRAATTGAALVLFVLTGVAANGMLGVGGLAVGTCAFGATVALGIPAQTTWVPDLVDGDRRTAAIGMTAVAHHATKLLGLVLAGVFLAGDRAAWGLALAAVLHALAAAVIHHHRAGARNRAIAAATPGPWRTLLADPARRRVLLVLAAFAMLGMPLQTLLPGLVDDPARYSTWLVAFSLGGIAAGSHPSRATQQDATTRRITGGIAAMALGTAASTGPSVFAGVVALLVAGAAWVWVYTQVNSLLQETAPPGATNRTMSLFGLAGLGTIPVGVLLSGLLADSIGEHTTVRLLAIGLATLAIAVSRSEE